MVSQSLMFWLNECASSNIPAISYRIIQLQCLKKRCIIKHVIHVNDRRCIPRTDGLLKIDAPLNILFIPVTLLTSHPLMSSLKVGRFQHPTFSYRRNIPVADVAMVVLASLGCQTIDLLRFGSWNCPMIQILASHMSFGCWRVRIKPLLNLDKEFHWEKCFYSLLKGYSTRKHLY